MNIEELRPIVVSMQQIAEEANVKRTKFKNKGMADLHEQALGEALGVGKCLSVLVERYPNEMNELTKVTE